MFHRTISNSGTLFSIWAFNSPEKSLKAAFDLGSLLGQNTQSKDVLLNILREAPAKEILELSLNLYRVSRKDSCISKCFLLLNSLLLYYVIKISSGKLLLICYCDLKYQSGSAFKPTLENPSIAPDEQKFMTQCYLNKYKSGDYYQVPHLMGLTSQEALLFIPGMNIFLFWKVSHNKALAVSF